MDQEDQKITITDLIEASAENNYLILMTFCKKDKPYFRLIDLFRCIADDLPEEEGLVDAVKSLCNIKKVSFIKNTMVSEVEGSLGKFWFVSETLANIIIERYLNLNKVKRSRGRPQKNYTPPKIG